MTRIEFGEHVKMIRTRKGLPQKALAIDMHCSTAFVSRMESGLKFPSMDKFFLMCDALDVSPSEFFYVMDKPASRFHREAVSASVKQIACNVDALKHLLGSYLVDL